MLARKIQKSQRQIAIIPPPTPQNGFTPLIHTYTYIHKQQPILPLHNIMCVLFVCFALLLFYFKGFVVTPLHPPPPHTHTQGCSYRGPESHMPPQIHSANPLPRARAVPYKKNMLNVNQMDNGNLCLPLPPALHPTKIMLY